MKKVAQGKFRNPFVSSAGFAATNEFRKCVHAIVGFFELINTKIIESFIPVKPILIHIKNTEKRREIKR